MPKLPVVSGVEVAKALAKIGYEVDHQTGSHLILRQKEYPHRRITFDFWSLMRSEEKRLKMKVFGVMLKRLGKGWKCWKNGLLSIHLRLVNSFVVKFWFRVHCLLWF